jgi:hypothetical protein
MAILHFPPELGADIPLFLVIGVAFTRFSLGTLPIQFIAHAMHETTIKELLLEYSFSTEQRNALLPLVNVEKLSRVPHNTDEAWTIYPH